MLDSSRVLVTTVIPAYQAARFIARALESAIAQNIPDHEIVVVDDGSTDGTRDVVRRYADHGVRLVGHRTSRGVSAARNTGIEAAQGEFVAFLDADDEWLPTKLARQLEFITNNPRMTFVSCRADLLDEAGNNGGDIYRGAPPPSGPEGWRALLLQPCVATPTVLARRSALNAVGGFNPWLPVAEDQDMWIRLALMGEVGYVPETLVLVYSTPNSLSKANIRKQSDVVLPMIVTYVERNRDRLTEAGARHIMSARYGKAGRLAIVAGEVGYGLSALTKAVHHGASALETIAFVIRATIVGVLKGVLRQFGALRPRALHPQGSAGRTEQNSFEPGRRSCHRPEGQLSRDEYGRTHHRAGP